MTSIEYIIQYKESSVHWLDWIKQTSSLDEAIVQVKKLTLNYRGRDWRIIRRETIVKEVECWPLDPEGWNV